MSERTAKRALFLIIGLYLVLGFAYSVINPIFESPDEALNYANIRFLVEKRRLPVLEPDEPTKAHHPPLYYVLGALLTHRVPNENFDAVTERVNPFWIHEVGEHSVDNKSLYLHDPSLEHFPYRDVALGVHLARWLSLLMGLGVVILVYQTTRELLPHRPALSVASAALVAFNPMFIYINTSVHDDPLANLVAAAILYVTAKMLMKGAIVRRAVWLGFLIGLAILTKLTCLLILPTVGLALLAKIWLSQKNRLLETLKLGGIIVLIAMLVGGWWLARNQILYGEPTSMGRQVEAWGGTRDNAPNVLAAARELGFLHDSFWGAFGYGQIPMPRWLNRLTRLLSLLAFGGVLLYFVRGRRVSLANDGGRLEHRQPQVRTFRPMTWLIVLSAPIVTFLVVFARMTMIDTADFGRYLFVSLAFLAPLYALGLSQWLPEREMALGLLVAMLALAVYALVGVLQPAYAKPKMLSPDEVAARTQPVDLRFGDAIRLIGYDLNRHRAQPGEDITVTLCWEALEEVDAKALEQNYAYLVHFLGPEETIVGARNTHPGLGRYPTSRWSPGDRFCDIVEVPVKTWAPAPAVYGVEVGWHKLGCDKRLPAYAPDGTRLELVLLDRIKVVPKTYPNVEVPHRVDANLGDQITLLGYDLSGAHSFDPDQNEVTICNSQPFTVTLYWEAQVSPPADYTVFVHVAASDGPPYAQADGQPRHGTYPTSYWDVGEVVTDTHTLVVPSDLSPGRATYPLVAGMYLLETGERLLWRAPDGTVQGSAVPLTNLSVCP